MKSLFSVFFLTLLGLMSAAQAQDLDTSRGPAQLKFDLVPGKTYVQTLESNQSTQMEIQGQKMDQKVNMTMVLSMAVEAGPENGKVVTVVYDRIAMKQDMAGMAIAYDSADPNASQSPLAMMGDMVGKPMKVTMNAEGEVVSVEGAEEIMQAAGGDNPMVGEMLKQFFGEDQLAQMMNTSMSQMIPSDPVAPGDTWPIDLKVSLGPMGEVTYKGTGTLLGYQKLDGVDVAVLDIEAETGLSISSEPTDGDDAASNPLAAMNMKLEEGTSKTRVYWDNTVGFMRASEMEQKMKMSMTNPVDGSALVIPTQQSTKATVEIK